MDKLALMIYNAIYGHNTPPNHQQEKLPKIKKWLKQYNNQAVSLTRLIEEWKRKDGDE